MEVLVGERGVLLSTHKTYRDDGEDSLRAVANYTPFRKYIEACTEHGPLPSTFIVRNIRRVAQRVVGVIMDVECKTQSGKVVQTVDLCDSAPVILLPVAVVNEVKYALLLSQRRVSTGCRFTVEAICGIESENGSFTGPNDELLISLGFDLQNIEVLSKTKYTVGNEGTTPYKVCSVSLTMTTETLQEIQRGTKDAETMLVAVPLDQVMSSVSDAKASLAASLLLALSTG